MALSFEFDEAPYAWCNGNYYNIGDTIEEPEGTSVTIYADIKCLDPNDTEAKARLVVIWDGYIKGSSGWDWYYVSDIKANRTCTVTIPSSQKDASFCVESELYSHDARCCITLKPKVTPSLTITPLSHDSPAAGDSFTITVTSNIAWTVSDGLTWLVYGPASGSGNGTVSIYVDPNTATTSRTGYIHITGGGITRTCTITQAAAAAPDCICTSWINAECVSSGIRRQTRTCTPAGCDIEEREIHDSTCLQETCTQFIKVVDEDGEIIENALISAESATHTTSCRTGANGEACSLELNTGDIYIAHAVEYTTLTPANFIACAGEETITAERDYCNQKFIVLNQFNEPIEGAEVECKSLWHFNPKATTNFEGVCGFNIKKGINWKAVATKDKYVCLNCEQDFTSCTSTITLTLTEEVTTCSQQFALRDKDTMLYIPDATVEVGGVPCTELSEIERYQIDNLTIGSSYNTIASKAGYECPDTLCETTFVADPANPAYNLYLKEIPTVDNYDIVFCVGKSVWGFDWIATNFVSKVLPKITSALNATGISGLVVHGEASYYNAEKKQIVVNADIPSHSPLAPLVLWLILTLVLPALYMLGVYVKETFFDKKGVEPATVTLRTIDTDSNVITEPISLTVNGVTKTTSGGVVSFAVNENFQVQCVSDPWDIFDSTKWYEPTTAMQDVVLSSTATRSVRILVTDEAGNPLPLKEVHVLDAYGKYVRTATTDENGYVTLNMGAGEYLIVVINEQGIPTGTTDIDPGTEDIEDDITVPEGYAFRVYARETGTSNYIDGANITVDGETGITDGKNGVLIAGLEDKDYTVTAQHPSYNNGDIVTYPEVVNPTTVLEDIIVDMVHTGEDALIRIYPRYETTNLVGAEVLLEGFVEKTTTQLGFVEYSNVPYGEYTVTAIKEDFTQKEPSKKYPVDESHTMEGVVTIVVVMESELIPPPPPPKLSMLLIYGVAAVGLYVGGAFVPKMGKVVQISALIPGLLLIYEGYKYVIAKIPFLSTELEQLALPLELTEPLRKKKLVIP